MRVGDSGRASSDDVEAYISYTFNHPLGGVRSTFTMDSLRFPYSAVEGIALDRVWLSSIGRLSFPRLHRPMAHKMAGFLIFVSLFFGVDIEKKDRSNTNRT